MRLGHKEVRNVEGARDKTVSGEKENELLPSRIFPRKGNHYGTRLSRFFLRTFKNFLIDV
jgi:hypothetical protein